MLLTSQLAGLFHNNVLILLAHGQKSIVQAPVLAVDALKVSICPVV